MLSDLSDSLNSLNSLNFCSIYGKPYYDNKPRVVINKLQSQWFRIKDPLMGLPFNETITLIFSIVFFIFRLFSFETFL